MYARTTSTPQIAHNMSRDNSMVFNPALADFLKRNEGAQYQAPSMSSRARGAPAITAVPGVGAIFLGAGSDLSQSLGVEENSPGIEQAFQTTLRACLDRNVACGITATTAQGIARRLGEGWKMIRTTGGALK
jgi:hypothetical protein